MIRPFDYSGITRDARGIAHYDNRPASLVEMLRATIARSPDHEAIVEIGGERVSYRQLWERAARVAGGLRAQGIKRGDRVAIRLGNGLDWVLAFFGIEMAGGIAVPVNTRFSESEVDYVIKDSGAAYVFMPCATLLDGEPFVVDDLQQSDTA